MAVTASWYGKGLQHVLAGDVAWGSNTIKVALTTSTYTPDIDTHEFFSTHVTNEVVGSGYTAGGVTLTTKTNSYDAANNRAVLDADNVTWNPSTITARRAIIYVAGVTPGTNDYLLGWVDFGQDESSSASEFTIVWDSTGILRLTAV